MAAPTVLTGREAPAALLQALGDPVRLAVLDLLASAPRTASQLAAEIGVAAPRLSHHLARLRSAGLVSVTHSGRHATYRLAEPGLLPPLRDLRQLALRASARPGSQPPARRPTLCSPLARARTCYDHLAGRLGVAIFDQLIGTGGLLPPPAADHSAVALGPAAGPGFAALGVDLAAPLPRRRQPALSCLDWTERRPHLGGALGAAVLDSLLARGWVQRGDGRALRVTAAGRSHLPGPRDVAAARP